LTKSTSKKLNDNEVIDLYLETQSQEYFSILYSRYSSKVYSRCLSLLKNEATAADASQDIFMKIFLNLAKFNQKSRFSTWVYSITYNYCIDNIRRKKKEKTVLTDEERQIEDVQDEVSDKELFEIELERIKEIMERIPAEDKAVLTMKYQEGLSIKDIGIIINKSESATKMKLKRAKHKVRTTYLENFKDKYASILFISFLLNLLA